VSYMPRREAEQRYGFRLFQGGVVPSRILRIVEIPGWDVEACGGTHARTTGEVGFIKIVKTERIQDGVERIEFVAGYSAVEYVQELDRTLNQASTLLGTQRENIPKVIASLKNSLEQVSSREKSLGERLVAASIPQILSSALEVKEGVRLYLSDGEGLSEELIIAQGQRAVAADEGLVFLSLFRCASTARVICFVGKKAEARGASADVIVRATAKSLGGSGGGSKKFAQGGGPNLAMLQEARERSPEVLSELIGR
jgi:alanyl-tRNA synthetase